MLDDEPQQVVAQLARQVGVPDQHIGFPRRQQAEGVDVGGAHRQPEFVDHRHLGMHEAGLVFVDGHPGLQQGPVQGVGGVVLEPVLHPSLQEQHDADASPRGGHQAMAKAPAGQKVGVGDQHLFPGRIEGPQVGRFDGPAVAEVVADHQRGRHRPRLRRHRPCGRDVPPGALELPPAGGAPLPGRLQAQILNQRPLHP